MNALLIVAHPDDEVLWFSTVLLRLQPVVVCVTGGRDASDQARRRLAFDQVMRLFEIDEHVWLDHPDTRERLDLERLRAELRPFAQRPFDMVFTHGPMGETYRNIHHQDVSYVVHQLFSTVHSTAYNQLPTAVHLLTEQEYTLKKFCMGTLYHHEYTLIEDAYEISALEAFTVCSPQASEIYYYGIARFGVPHELLAKYSDFWGFRDSPYEMERHAMIVSLVERARPRQIVEYGACEGVLTQQLTRLAPTDCVEQAPTYRRRLSEQGFRVVDRPRTEDYDLAVVAAFLEYIEDPVAFLADLRTRWLVVDVILGSTIDEVLDEALEGWRRVSAVVVRPRWERMYWGGRKESFEVYRLGARGSLFERLTPRSREDRA